MSQTAHVAADYGLFHRFEAVSPLASNAADRGGRHPDFYPGFGFEQAARYGLTCEWDVPAEAFMAAVLKPEVTSELAGLAKYRSEFSTVE